MNKRLSKLFATLLVTVIVLGAFPILMPAKATVPLPPAFYIIPDHSFLSPPTTVGTTFTEFLYVSTSAATFTYQYEVDFDYTQLACVSSGTAFSNGTISQFFFGHTAVPAGPTIDNTTGTITGGETLLGADSVPATPSGALIINMTFITLIGPPINGNLTSLISVNPANSFLLDPDLGTVGGVSFGNATYFNKWAAPALPHLAVEPTPQTFNKFVLWNGTTFTVDVVIKGISSSWFLGNATVQLDYNASLTTQIGVVFDPIWITTAFTDTGPGLLQFDVSNPSSVPNGDVKIATITFNITDQGSVPPRVFGDADLSILTLHNYALGSTANFYISTTAAVNGLVTVECFVPVAPPYLSVSSATLGPGPVIGQLFDITVTFNNVRDFENIIGIQFRLSFDETLIYPQAGMVSEGPFLPSYAALQPGSLGTFFTYFIEDPDGVYGRHVLVGNMIFPDGMGVWHAPMLNGTDVITTITFKVLAQPLAYPSYVTPLNIVDQEAIALDNLVSQNIVTYPLSDPHNGTVTILPSFASGRVIDEYGGAVNSGMIQLVGAPYLQFPYPYGGQGPNMQMDMVEPQSWVWLHANVTYNGWPVQFKNVGFEVDMPNGTVYTKMSAFTDVNGVATVGFRMPWPCDINTTSHKPHRRLDRNLNSPTGRRHNQRHPKLALRLPSKHLESHHRHVPVQPRTMRTNHVRIRLTRNAIIPSPLRRLIGR